MRVAGYSVRLARHLALPESEVEMIHYAALVHDIGKIAQRPDVIRKPTPLTEEERRLMMRHPEAGAKIVCSTDAHSTRGLGNMQLAVATARRGAARAADVVNTSPLPGLLGHG